jgi:Cu(I)/Ag(I) efflux system membrane fusion protein
MVPGNKFDKPAKSPFMDMMLVPVYADGDTDGSKVTVSPRIQQNLGCARPRSPKARCRRRSAAVGSIAWNERDQVVVQARATGYVERCTCAPRSTASRKGQPLAELYVPEWVAAQEEFLSVGACRAPTGPLIDGARQRMRQVGMSEAPDRSWSKAAASTQPRITLVAPIGGVVAELMAREGMTVMPGRTLFRINGLGTVWANAEVPESQAALLRPGAKVQARSPGRAGNPCSKAGAGAVPEVNRPRARSRPAELANPRQRWCPACSCRCSSWTCAPARPC